jgi:DNA-binding Lrp family transcriptional regulator
VIKAYILVQTEVGSSAQVTHAIAEIPGVVSADTVAGPYDVVAVVEAPTVSELGKEVISRVQAIPRITRTTTCTVVDL